MLVLIMLENKNRRLPTVRRYSFHTFDMAYSQCMMCLRIHATSYLISIMNMNLAA